MIDASPQAVRYLRVATAAVGGYDYLITLPAEYRFYKTQRRLGRITLSYSLFFLIRYLSIVLLSLSMVIWFRQFTLENCRRVYLLPPTFKVLQVMVSQMVLSVRTYNLSQRSRLVGLALFVLYITTCVVQWVASFYNAYPYITSDGMECRRVIKAPGSFGIWTYYMASVIYDFIVTAISFIYLAKYYFSATTSVISSITRIMIYDGLGYFILLSAANIFNLALFRTTEPTEGFGVSLSYVTTWIMTQRILIDLHEASIKHQNADDLVTISRTIDSAQAVSSAIRHHLESNKDEDWTEPSLDAISSAERGEPTLDVNVRIERTVRVQDHPWLVERGLCRARTNGDADLVSYGSWTTATHDTRDEAIRAARDPLMVTIR